ncbi:hypothetical protein C8F04DRAFT_1189450 [Mycena alexandri]|uniref:Uncharacterized protein n=1 Tax=Mycena alexandri TaxID=1745969 RepID=A0AAD6SHX3_9AGAR|nr:hypothetical protein C8F04DRAFT_1189450 [Mycena alexandri]
MVKTQEHRKAINSVLLSTHRLARKVLCYINYAHQPVPRAERLHRSLVQFCATFFAKLFTDLPELRIQMMVLSNIDFFKAIIYPCSTITLVATFVLELLHVLAVLPRLAVGILLTCKIPRREKIESQEEEITQEVAIRPFLGSWSLEVASVQEEVVVV